MKTTRNKLKELRLQLNEVSALKSEIEELKSQMKSSAKVSGSGNDFDRKSRYRNRGRPKCDQCKNNNVDRCPHCIKCGSSDHFIKDCKSSN